MPEPLPTYRIEESLAVNLERGPRFLGPHPEFRFGHPCSFLGRRINSPLGIAAGPLFDSKWVRLYSRLGFDVLTYKTVRTRAYPGYADRPNMCRVGLDVQVTSDDYDHPVLAAPDPGESGPGRISAANSFGMPSAAPERWIADIRYANAGLYPGQLLILSVTGTLDEGSGASDLVADFAHCAELARIAGAEVVEANLACPNVTGLEGTIYADPPLALRVVTAIRERIGELPLLIKIGYLPDGDELRQLVELVAPHVQGIPAINAPRVPVIDQNGRPRFPGRSGAGLGGWAIRRLGLETVEALCRLRERLGLDYAVLGVGGVTDPQAITQYLDAGAAIVLAATAVIWDPYMADAAGRTMWPASALSWSLLHTGD